ncbi:MAG: acyl-CoA dehydratase activase-related protein [Bacteroides sp.]|nr:acyl-CoA dehydratase activase-related protein [Bacteroides sp.]
MEQTNTGRIGIDAGSTTLKIVVSDPQDNIVYKSYKRHKARFNELLALELENIRNQFPGTLFVVHITGSAGMGISERTGIPFIQEVVASTRVINHLYPDIHTLIDLGGEDAKMVFFEKGREPDIRMNGSCAGGTGAFIDQMADLLNIPVEHLNEEALRHRKIYPVASRCGVFAKTDVQNLISRNVSMPDIAMSILHAVALQCITTLARGYTIEPRILCTGGPFTFIPALREAFAQLLKLEEKDMVLPDNSEYFPAWGAALARENEQWVDMEELLRKLQAVPREKREGMTPLFENETSYKEWKKARKIKKLVHIPIENGRQYDCFLGIDSGSTTTKIVITDTKDRILYTYYTTNQGNPLKKVIEGLTSFYNEVSSRGATFRFQGSAATGYGEDLIRSALNLDYGIVETMAHLSGAQYTNPDVTFVLDIGGQDMKALFIENGAITQIELNEACSSGCGSFLQNFASTMQMSLEEFTHNACLAPYPCDLGSRCTVFMNSKVKQSLRENASPGDIAGGLAYSVIKNCLFKVLKLSTLNQVGDHIVVQGGTFRNDAVYRALEILSGKQVSSTDSPELMGALGAALYARKMRQKEALPTRFTGNEPLLSPDQAESRELQCKGCTNHCSVLCFRFPNGNKSYAGNKCEKVFFNKNRAPEKGYNAFDEKNRILFHQPLSHTSGSIVLGIPRVLNLFENYPFWYTLLTECGFRVVLSPESTYTLYEKGVGSVMSDNICFPAKLAHGHIHALAEEKVDRIFYPLVIKEEKEVKATCNSFNCPVVSGYPEVIRSSMEPEDNYGIPLDKPVISFMNRKALARTTFSYLSKLGVSRKTFKEALSRALEARERVKEELVNRQKRRFEEAIAQKRSIFVVAGRPYHTDPLIHQKVGQIIADMGADVFTDDLFRKDSGTAFSSLNLVAQWSYPNRVIQAAIQVAQLPHQVQFIQLNSFGCGPDSFFMDETGEILRQAGKNHTILRIDEIASPGSVRLRIRSLIESLRSIHPVEKKRSSYKGYDRGYRKEDREKTILIPWFSDFISPFLPALGELTGYKLENLPPTTPESAGNGLRYGHNEVCYPSTLILGDIITALQSGKYDTRNIVVAITQTGGQCRATNYVAQIKTGLKQAGFSDIPVLVLSFGEVYQNDQEAFRINFSKIIPVTVQGLLYGDSLQKMYNHSVVREKNRGESRKLFDQYIEEGIEAIRKNSPSTLRRLLEEAVQAFNNLPIENREYTPIGLIGEIYLKYNNYAQAYITRWLQSRNMEVDTPSIVDFILQYFVNAPVNRRNRTTSSSLPEKIVAPLFYHYIKRYIHRTEEIMKQYRFYRPDISIFTKAEYASEVLDLSHQFGEGWMIAAEIAAYARKGVNRVVCIQPFGCIANHVVAKGVEKRLKRLYPGLNLLYLDIDGGTAEVNLQNRLYFMIHEPTRN